MKKNILIPLLLLLFGSCKKNSHVNPDIPQQKYLVSTMTLINSDGIDTEYKFQYFYDQSNRIIKRVVPGNNFLATGKLDTLNYFYDNNGDLVKTADQFGNGSIYTYINGVPATQASIIDSTAQNIFTVKNNKVVEETFPIINPELIEYINYDGNNIQSIIGVIKGDTTDEQIYKYNTVHDNSINKTVKWFLGELVGIEDAVPADNDVIEEIDINKGYPQTTVTNDFKFVYNYNNNSCPEKIAVYMNGNILEFEVFSYIKAN